jgi:hypothetical protein
MQGIPTAQIALVHVCAAHNEQMQDIGVVLPCCCHEGRAAFFIGGVWTCAVVEEETDDFVVVALDGAEEW